MATKSIGIVGYINFTVNNTTVVNFNINLSATSNVYITVDGAAVNKRANGSSARNWYSSHIVRRVGVRNAVITSYCSSVGDTPYCCRLARNINTGSLVRTFCGAAFDDSTICNSLYCRPTRSTDTDTWTTTVNYTISVIKYFASTCTVIKIYPLNSACID